MTTFRPRQLSVLGRLGLALTSALALVAAFTLASVLFVVILGLGLVLGGWLWWQLRRLNRQQRKAAATIIEGEYTVVSDRPALENRQPANPTDHRPHQR